MRASKVTVVIATYNGAEYFDEQLSSIKSQTRQPDEIVISDDGSSDLTVQFARKFSREVPYPVRILEQPQRLGPSQNFGAALRAATGDILFCCDQDDRWHANKIQRVASIFESDPAVGLVMNNADIVDEQLVSRGIDLWTQFGFSRSAQNDFETGNAFAVLTREMPVYGCTIAVRSQFRREFLPIPLSANFDSWIGAITASVAACRLIPESLQEYRQHHSQVTGLDEVSLLKSLLIHRAKSDAAAMEREAEQLRDLSARLSLLDGSVDQKRAIRLTSERLELTQRRQIARASLMKRVPLVLASLASGAYASSARGFRSAAVDLISRADRVL